MLDGMELFHMGYSWGGFESLMIPFHLERVRSATPREAKMGRLRLHIGLENVDDLIADLEKGLHRLTQAQG
jgi:cystathionine beta-lyase